MTKQNDNLPSQTPHHFINRSVQRVSAVDVLQQQISDKVADSVDKQDAVNGEQMRFQNCPHGLQWHLIQQIQVDVAVCRQWRRLIKILNNTLCHSLFV